MIGIWVPETDVKSSRICLPLAAVVSYPVPQHFLQNTFSKKVKLIESLFLFVEFLVLN
jgi:hypothetical protein